MLLGSEPVLARMARIQWRGLRDLGSMNLGIWVSLNPLEEEFHRHQLLSC